MFECIPGPGHPNEPKRPHMAAQHIAHDIVAQSEVSQLSAGNDDAEDRSHRRGGGGLAYVKKQAYFQLVRFLKFLISCSLNVSKNIWYFVSWGGFSYFTPYIHC